MFGSILAAIFISGKLEFLDITFGRLLYSICICKNLGNTITPKTGNFHDNRKFIQFYWSQDRRKNYRSDVWFCIPMSPKFMTKITRNIIFISCWEVFGNNHSKYILFFIFVKSMGYIPMINRWIVPKRPYFGTFNSNYVWRTQS